MSEPEVRLEQRSQVTPRTVFTVCFAVLGVIILVTLVVKTRVALTLTGMAALIALALEHGVSRLEKRGLKRWLAIALVLLALFIAMAALGLLVIPDLVEQVDALVTQWPQLWKQMRGTGILRALNQRLHSLGWNERLEEATPALAGPLPALLMSAIGGVVGLLGGILTVFFLVVFMLVFGGGVLKRLLDLSRPDHRLRYVRVLRNIYTATGGYLSGITLICAINATLTTTMLAVLGMPFYLPLGVASGFSSLVPYAGPIIAGGIITLLTLATGGLWKALAVFVYFLLYGQLEGNVMAPLVFKRTVHVNPLITLLAVLFCVELAGIVGAVVAVPVAAAVQIIVREVLLFRQERRSAAVHVEP
ncbi:AI-2E family transporter [Corallococcus llansteffanensis]|uniref:AI-2E family transporter n=1 Tax=Corallococcus llansteffanensis TaxID=2316731 RepID=A0A3A8Q6H4_9BACT|nr:AI-2E family transporter [Corallococcus llansteffanensis]RKH61795.1 AI-2E family transporter [Corallococcus llansteffanensis]